MDKLIICERATCLRKNAGCYFPSTKYESLGDHTHGTAHVRDIRILNHNGCTAEFSWYSNMSCDPKVADWHEFVMVLLIMGNSTCVVIRMDPTVNITDMNKYYFLWGGTATYNPKDEYSFMVGLRAASRRAFAKESVSYHSKNYKAWEHTNKMAYRSVRSLLVFVDHINNNNQFASLKDDVGFYIVKDGKSPIIGESAIKRIITSIIQGGL